MGRYLIWGKFQLKIYYIVCEGRIQYNTGIYIQYNKENDERLYSIFQKGSMSGQKTVPKLAPNNS